MRDNVAYMPPPSVVAHKAAEHVPFIAWKDSEAVFENTANIKVEQTADGTNFIVLDQEQLFLNDDQTAPPTIDTSFDDHVAHVTSYAKLSSPPVFDQDHVPLKGHLPEGRAESSYLEFGHGKIESDWDTSKLFVFRDKNGVASDPTPRRAGDPRR
jgi:hypothetical protein